jgi:hypothetical protein
MSYYSRSDSDFNWVLIIICFVLAFALVMVVNSRPSRTWNNGVCPRCRIRYELMDVSNGIKYYVCPECGQEVERY